MIVGIAGSGKTTTALDAASAALEEAGYRVIGTATSGQAARTLGAEAGIEARTMRSLLWQLEHGRIVLDRDCVMILARHQRTRPRRRNPPRRWGEHDRDEQRPPRHPVGLRA